MKAGCDGARPVGMVVGDLPHRRADATRDWTRALAKKIVALTGVAVLCAWVGVLRAPQPGPIADPDSDWKASYAALWQQGQISGRDFAFTYGPLSQLIAAAATRLHVADDPLGSVSLVDLLFSAVGLVMCCVLVCLVPGIDWQRAAAVLAFLALLQVPYHFPTARPLTVLLAGGLAALATAPRLAFCAPILAVTAGLAAFIGQLLTAEVGVYGCATVFGFLAVSTVEESFSGGLTRGKVRRALVRHGRIAGLAAGAFLLANTILVLVFAATDDRPSSLLAYPSQALGTISGYAAAVGLPWSLPGSLTAALAIVALWTCGWIAARSRCDTGASVRVLVAFALGSLVTLKGATVRADIGHVFLGVTPFFVTAACAAAYASAVRARLWPWLLAAWAVIAGWPIADESVWRVGWMSILEGQGPRGAIRAHRRFALPQRVPSDLVVPAGPARPTAVVPYFNYLILGLGRPLVAGPVFQPYAAFDTATQERYVRALAERGDPDVVLVTDVALDAVQTSVRLPVIFESLVTRYAVAASAPPAHRFLWLRPRPRPAELVRTPLEFRRDGDGATVEATLARPSGCSLVALDLQLRYPAWAPLLRPEAFVVTVSEGVVPVVSTRLVPLGDSTSVYVWLAPSSELPSLFAGTPPEVRWNHVRVEHEQSRLAADPDVVTIDRLSCVRVAVSGA